MVGQRDRILNLVKYIQSKKILVNIGKNKARGNKGVFIRTDNAFRIDIAKNMSDDEILHILLHEFAHYFHSLYDKSLKKLDFIFEEYNDEIKNELINITVQYIPKKSAELLFDKKDNCSAEIKKLAQFIKNSYPSFKLSSKDKLIEKQIKFPASCLLKYDSIKVFNKIYTRDNLEKDFAYLTPIQIAYINLKSKQRQLSRINSRISGLNKYYNNPSELFARFSEMYFTDRNSLRKLAPVSTEIITQKIKNGQMKEYADIERILNIC